MKTQIKNERRYNLVKGITVSIDTDAAGRKYPELSSLDKVLAETIQDAKYFRIEGIKTGKEYNVRIYGSKNKEQP